MSIQTPTEPPVPGSAAPIHASGITGVATLAVLLVLNGTVFRHTGAPADIGYFLSPAVSYGVSVVAGYLTRRRVRRTALAPPVAAPTDRPPPGAR